MRLIDADKINYHEHTECMGHGDFETVRTVTDKEIAEIPTVDAVEVVRCRYCKYYVKFESSLIGEVMCCTGQGSVNIQKQPDDFCSCGKRKDGDKL